MKVSQEGQITERLARAIDQLENSAIEIRLGGVYALVRIANESEKDYWPIMEIFTAYVRKNSCVDSRLKEKSKTSKVISMDIQTNESTKKEFSKTRKIPFDIQAILTVIGRPKNSLNHRESKCLNLEMTCLQGADLIDTYFEGANFINAHLEGVYLKDAHLEGADLKAAHLEMANLEWAKLERVNLKNVYLEKANLSGTNLEVSDLKNANFKKSHLVGANLKVSDLKNVIFEGANLMWTNFKRANLNGANLKGANLKGAKDLSLEQLSEVETIYKAELNESLCTLLKAKHPALFAEPN